MAEYKKRLIYANDVEFALQAICDRESGVPIITAEWLASVVRKAPTVDAVEVVRCEKCKYAVCHDLVNKTVLCQKRSAYPSRWDDMPLDGFCSYGERKDNG